LGFRACNPTFGPSTRLGVGSDWADRGFRRRVKPTNLLDLQCFALVGLTHPTTLTSIGGSKLSEGCLDASYPIGPPSPPGLIILPITPQPLDFTRAHRFASGQSSPTCRS